MKMFELVYTPELETGKQKKNYFAMAKTEQNKLVLSNFVYINV